MMMFNSYVASTGGNRLDWMVLVGKFEGLKHVKTHGHTFPQPDSVVPVKNSGQWELNKPSEALMAHDDSIWSAAKTHMVNVTFPNSLVSRDGFWGNLKEIPWYLE